MEPLNELVARLRIARGLTQADLAHRAGCSVATLGGIEQGVSRRTHPRTAKSIYDALAKVHPLTEQEAADFIAQTGMSLALAGAPSGRLPDSQYMDEVVAGRVQYAGSDPHQRPPVARETLIFAGYRPGANAPEAAELTVPVIQAVADLVVTVGPAKAEAAIRSALSLLTPHVAPQGVQSIAPKPDDIRPPRGSVAKPSGEGSKEFIPHTAPAKTADPSKPKAAPINRRQG